MVTEKESHSDVHKECSPLEASAASSLPTMQLPKHALGSDDDDSNGGNEPDVSCSVSEGEGNAVTLLSSLPQENEDDVLLQLPSRTRHGGDGGADCDSESENSSTGSIEDELEDLSLHNKLHQPHRDGSDQDGGQPDSLSVATITVTSNSYIHGENGSDRVRHLVKRSISKKRKQQQRQAKPKKETKAPLAAGRRSKKTNRNAIKHSMDTTTIF